MSLNRLAVAKPARPPAALAADDPRGRARRRRPVRRPGHERRRRGVGRAPSTTSSAGPTCASPPSARPACRPRRVAAIAGTPGVAVAAPALERRTYLGADLGRRRRPPAAGHGPRHRPAVDGRSCTTCALVDGSPLRDPAEPSALITERLAAQDGLALGSPLTMQGAGDGVTYRVVGILARRRAADRRLRPDGRRPAGRPRRQVFGETGVTRVDIGLTGRADSAAVSAAARVAAQDRSPTCCRRRRTSRRPCAARPPTSRRRPR